MPFTGVVSFNVLQIVTGADLFNWAFTAISAFGLVAVGAGMLTYILGNS